MFEAYINYLINYDWATHFAYGLYYLVFAIVVIVGWEMVVRKELINYLIRKLYDKPEQLEDNK